MFSRQVFLDNSKFLAPKKNLPKRRIGMLGSVSPKIRGPKKKYHYSCLKPAFPPKKKNGTLNKSPLEIFHLEGETPKKTDPLKQLRVDSALEVRIKG